MTSKTSAAESRRDAAEYIAALKEERAGYARRGDAEHLKQIDAEIKATEKRLSPAKRSQASGTTRPAGKADGASDAKADATGGAANDAPKDPGSAS